MEWVVETFRTFKKNEMIWKCRYNIILIENWAKGGRNWVCYSDNYFTINTEDKAKEFGLAIIKAVKKTHTIANKCKKLTEELDVAKKCDDKELINIIGKEKAASLNEILNIDGSNIEILYKLDKLNIENEDFILGLQEL